MVWGQFVLVFRQQWIHLYYLTPSGDTSGVAEMKDLSPIAAHKWQWRIDTLIVLRQEPHPLLDQFCDAQPTADMPTPICILLRFDSWFPWPVNILHQFILPVNPLYVPGRFDSSTASSQPVNPQELPYLGTFLSKPIDLADEPTTPTHLKPYVVSSMPSPIRIFTPSDTVLGVHGTALWLDAQTDSALPAQAGDRGQRIASKTLRFVKPSQTPEEMPRYAVNLESRMGNNGTEFVEEDNTDQVVVFHLQEEKDHWGKLAVCDEEGWMAVGCTDGRILVYDYA